MTHDTATPTPKGAKRGARRAPGPAVTHAPNGFLNDARGLAKALGIGIGILTVVSGFAIVDNNNGTFTAKNCTVNSLDVIPQGKTHTAYAAKTTCGAMSLNYEQFLILEEGLRYRFTTKADDQWQRPRDITDATHDSDPDRVETTKSLTDLFDRSH